MLVFAGPDDPRLTPDETEDWAEYAFLSGLSLPLVVGDDVVGLIDVFDTRERDYAEAREFLLSAGRMVADGLQNAQLLASLQQSNRGLRELVELGDAISEADDLDQLVRTVARRLRETLQAEDCDIWRIEDDRLRCLASIDSGGWDEGEIGLTRELADYPGTIVALEHDEPIVLGDFDQAASELAAEERTRYDHWGYRSMVSLPLVLEGRPVGLVDIFDTRVRDWAELMDLIRNVGRLLAGAFEKAVLLDQLERGNSELRLLVQSGLDFGATLDHDAVIGTVARRIREVCGADMCDVYAVDGAEAVTLTSVDHHGEIDPKGIRYAMSDYYGFLEALETKAPVVVTDMLTDLRATPGDRADAERVAVQGDRGHPVHRPGRGHRLCLALRPRSRRLSAEDPLVGLAQIAAQAIANARVTASLDDHAAASTC